MGTQSQATCLHTVWGSLAFELEVSAHDTLATEAELFPL